MTRTPARPTLSRRLLLGSAAAAIATAAHARIASEARSRVIVDNDFHGDPDGLIHLAHQLLSPGSQVQAIIASHLPAFEPSSAAGQTARGAAKVRDLLQIMDLPAAPPVIPGSDAPLKGVTGVQSTAAARAIMAEAMRTDTTLPLYYAAGAGLTALATAWLLEPRIGKRITLLWIGGQEYPGLAPPPPKADKVEFNLGLDVVAAKVIFEQSDIALWQVPRTTYRQLLYSHAELDRHLRPCGALGAYLVEQMVEILKMGKRFEPTGLGEIAILGDSPLVTLSALQSSFNPDPSSSQYVIRPAPGIAADGAYVDRPQGRPIRVYTSIDARLTFQDMLAKFQDWAASRPR